jgi:predicted pyridoxine 5'-phosphate oxidase superfamily flavin-nucleotide-binding protein
MGRAFSQLTFTPAVKSAQARYGGLEYAARLEKASQKNDRLNEDLTAFIAGIDSFFMATANRDGWPYVQHRGGPPGFLKVLDDRTLAFADYGGNKQFLTIGNLLENDRVCLFVIDYAQGRRLKLWGHATVIDDDQAFRARVRDPDYPAPVERIVRIDLKAWDLNCRQHFPRLVNEQVVRRLVEGYERRIAALRARIDELVGGPRLQ